MNEDKPKLSTCGLLDLETRGSTIKPQTLECQKAINELLMREG